MRERRILKKRKISNALSNSIPLNGRVRHSWMMKLTIFQWVQKNPKENCKATTQSDQYHNVDSSKRITGILPGTLP